MFNCKEVSRLVSESMDHNLPVYQRMLIWIHLLVCRYCARFRRQVMFLRKLCCSLQPDERFIDTSVVLPPDACKRIRNALRSS